MYLRGDFQSTYFTGDNANVVPTGSFFAESRHCSVVLVTDTQKNTVYVLAKTELRAGKSIGSCACDFSV